VQASSLSGTLQGYILVLEGDSPEAGVTDGRDRVTFRLTAWRTAGGLGGTLEYEVRHGGPVQEVGAEKTSGELTTASRSMDPAPTFEGTWRGWYVIQACEVQEWLQCYHPRGVGDTMGLELALVQSASVVTGTLWPDYTPSTPDAYAYRIDVSGVASGDTLDLTGSGGPWPVNRNATRRLLSFRARRDPVGRLSGNFTWQDDWVSTGPANPGLQRTVRTGELYNVLQLR
jgi:hypothetical protein